MAPRTIYANLADGLQPFNLWDQSLADMGNLGVIPCTAVGTNSIVLTPIPTVFAPTIAAPQSLQAFSFIATASSSGAVTIQIGTTASLKLYRMDGVTQASTGDIVNTVLYVIGYNAALNGAVGGFQILAPISNEINPIISGATISGSTITTSTYNGNTWTAGTGILTIAALKTLTVSNTLTLAGTDSTVMTFPTTSATLARTDAANTFTGTQTIGALVATTFNGNTLTTGTYTLTGTAAKTLNFTNSLTLSGTDATTMTFPSTTGAVQTADSTGAFTNKTFNTAATGNVFQINGVTISANTGTGSNVLATTPTLVTPVLGAATATSINGSTVSPGHYSGEPSNGSAVAGEIGDYTESIVATGSAVVLTTGVAKTVTQLTNLPAGDWDVDCVVQYTTAAGTSVTGAGASISLATNTLDVTAGRFVNTQFAAFVPGASSAAYGVAVPPLRFSLSTPTTIFMVAFANFSVAAFNGFGIIRARRPR